jgi:predicted nuclease with TOPRIM domain
LDAAGLADDVTVAFALAGREELEDGLKLLEDELGLLEDELKLLEDEVQTLEDELELVTIGAELLDELMLDVRVTSALAGVEEELLG